MLLEAPENVQRLQAETALSLLGPVAALYAHLQARVAANSSMNGAGAATESHVGLLTAGELASRLGVSTDWVYRHANELSAVRLGGHVRFSPEALTRFLRTRRL